MGEPQEKPPGTPASRTWLASRGQSKAITHTRHRGEMIERLTNSALNRSVTGVSIDSLNQCLCIVQVHVRIENFNLNLKGHMGPCHLKGHF